MLNEYSQPVANTLEQYIPAPLQQMYQAGQAIQARGDLAQQQNDQALVGLSSMEVLAPSQRDYINQSISGLKAQQSALVDKYGNNYADPNFMNEARRINMQFAADPKLQLIKETNDNIKRKQAIASELQSKGIKYIDSNPTFSGTDNNGNLLTDPGHLQATNFDTNIDQGFRDKSTILSSIHGRNTNQPALHTEYNSRLAGLANGTDQDMMQAVQYYKQQGASDHDAKVQAVRLLDKGMGFLRDEPDTASASLALQQAEFNERVRHDKADEANSAAKNNVNGTPSREIVAGAGNPPFNLLDFSKPIVPTGSNSQDIKQTTPNSEMYNKVQKVISGLSNDGNLNSSTRNVDDTPENRKAFGKNGTPSQIVIAGGGMGYGTSSYPVLSVKSYDPSDVAMLSTARKILGVTGGSAKTVLSKYSDLIKSFDNASYKVTSTDNKKLNDDMAEVSRRQISTGEVYKNVDGALTKVTDPKELDELVTSSNQDASRDNEIKNIQIAGISPKSLGPLNGFTQFSNKGTNYYTPLPDQMQQKFSGSKSVESYIQDFDPSKLKETTINTRTGAVKAFIDPNKEPMNYEFAGIRGRLLPYKATQDGKLGGGGLFQYIDPKTGKENVVPIPMSELEREEKTSLFTDVVNDNKIKGN